MIKTVQIAHQVGIVDGIAHQVADMEKRKTRAKILFYISLVFLAYFSFIMLDSYVLKLDFTIIDVVRELITLPLLFLQVVFFFFAIRNAIKDGFRTNTYSFWTFMVFLICILVTWGLTLYQR